MANIKYVHTLGDSTLDNMYWMLDIDGQNIADAKAQSVEGQLAVKLQNQGLYHVVSHAFDGFTTSSVLGTDTVGRVLPGIGQNSLSPIGEAYLKCKNIDPKKHPVTVQPLKLLRESIAAAPEGSTHYVVLSVGGNDFREKLLDPIDMLRSIQAVIGRYFEILNQLKGLAMLEGKNIKPILMFQYRVDANNDVYLIYTLLKIIGIATLTLASISTFAAISPLLVATGKIGAVAASILFPLGVGGLALCNHVLPLRMIKNVLSGQELRVAALGVLMEKFYQLILKRAKEENIPILDLPNTFNPYEDLYVAGIEPGKEGGKLIAEGIAYIIQYHDFASESKLYAKKDDQDSYKASTNPGEYGWRVTKS